MGNPKVFISHAHEDKKRFVTGFARKLRENGVEAWIDEWEIAPGDSLVDKIFEEGIKECDSFLIVLSKNSVNKKWVKEELNSAVIQRIEKDTDLIPILIDENIEIPVSLQNTLRVEINDLSNYETELENLLMKLYGVSKKPALGKKPKFVVDYIIQGYTKLDSLVLRNIGDLIIEKEDFNYIISGKELLKRIEKYSINEDQIQESLEILDNDHQINLTITSGSLIHYPIQLTSLGFLTYAENFIKDFHQVELKVVSAIYNDNLRLDMDIAKKKEIPIAIVDFLLKRYVKEGYTEFGGYMGGPQMIGDITATGKRHFRNFIISNDYKLTAAGIGYIENNEKQVGMSVPLETSFKKDSNLVKVLSPATEIESHSKDLNKSPIDGFTKLVANALPNKRRYILFVGAGVSKEAGLPTSNDLVLKIAKSLYINSGKSDSDINLKEWFNNEYSNIKYSDLINELYPTPVLQQSFLGDCLNDDYDVSDVHKLIVELVELKVVRAIVTTNFDQCIEKALKERGIKPQVISTTEDLNASEPLIQCETVRIYKPHGTLGQGFLKNTPKDLESLSKDMEEELVKVLNDHGVIVLGYSGNDRSIQKVFKKVNFKDYPAFWVNPSQPAPEMEKILSNKENYHYIHCEGASQFIKDFLKRSKNGTGNDLKEGLTPINSMKESCSDFLEGIYGELKENKPDFSNFEKHDDAVVEQIRKGALTSYKFIERVKWSVEREDINGIKRMYKFYGNLLNLYNEDCNVDAYKFLIYELFVSFISILIKYDQWELISEILNEKLFVESSPLVYVPFTYINRYIKIIDRNRNERLKLRRVSLMADMIKERFTETDLSKLVTHKQFMEADYFLFIRTLCNNEQWVPRASILLDKTPSYLLKAQNKLFLEKLINAAGFESKESFMQCLKRANIEFEKIYSYEVESPLEFFDLGRLGIDN